MCRFFNVDTLDVVDFNILSKEEKDALRNYDLTFGIRRRYEYKGNVSYFSGVRDDPRRDASLNEYAATIKKLTVPAHHVVFIDGHKERSIERAWESDWNRMAGFYEYRYALVNNGFNVSKINLSGQDIPSFTDILVIADPQLAFSHEELQKLKAYVDKGGNVLFASEARWSQITKPIQDLLGISISSTEVQTIEGKVTAPEFKSFGINNAYSIELNSSASIETNTERGFKSKAVLSADGKNLMLALQREINGKQQKIIVSGDADFVSDKETLKNKRVMAVLPGEMLSKSIFYWLSNGDYPVKLIPRVAKDKNASLSNEKVSLYKLLYIWIFPFIILFTGGFVFWRRRQM